MSEKMHPLSFEKLMAMLMEEFKLRGSIFGVNELWQAGKQRLPIFGMRIESPLGPSAGPSTQLAEGIIAAYVAGARYIELRTVCEGEPKKTGKPGIVTENETYNGEEYSELSVGEAFDEYVKAWFAIKLICAEYNLGLPDGFIFNMSVGSSLKSIQSDKINSFIEGLKSAEYTPVWRECENWIRGHLDEFDRLDGIYVSDISPNICNSITFNVDENTTALEIEQIGTYLIEEKKLNTFMKVSPTLLGYDEVRGSLDALGYDSLELDGQSFDECVKYEELRPVFHRLQDKADANRLVFGVKVCGALPVKGENDSLFGEKKKLSGRALFPIAFALTEKIARDFGGGLRISYSGGADIDTVSDLFNCGVWPITVASEILLPGGYGRFTQMAEALSKCEFLPFSGILTNDLTPIDDMIAKTDKYRARDKKRVKKAEGPIPLLDCFISPCREACPIMADIPAFLRLMKEGKKLEALRVITQRNPLPFITGALCPHYCMSACNRRFYECPINIKGVELLAAEGACFDRLDELTPTKENGEKIAIVGAGPAGLAAAYFFANAGYDTTVFDKSSTPGGAVRKALPAFRVAEKAIEWDCALIQAVGVKMELEREITSIKELRSLGYEKIVLAIGAESTTPIKLSAGKAVTALDFLCSYKQNPEKIGEEVIGNVVVIGDENSAVDSARVAKRLPNVDKVTLVFRNGIACSKASEEEISLAKKEGIHFEEMLIPTALRGGNLFFHIGEMGQKDKKGTFSIVDTGKRSKMPADYVIATAGETCQSPLLDEVDSEVYIIGDAKTGPASVIEAVADAGALAKKITHRSYDKYSGENLPDDYKFLDKRGIITDPADCHEGDRCLECKAVCESCVECCPNRANVRITLPDGSRQILHLDALCNECGNCASFCPYDASPYKDKFTLFADDESFYDSENEGFYPTGEAKICRIRLGGKAFKFDPINGPSGVLDESVRTLIKAVISDYPRFLGLEE